MFGWAAITLGISPHSSFPCIIRRLTSGTSIKVAVIFLVGISAFGLLRCFDAVVFESKKDISAVKSLLQLCILKVLNWGPIPTWNNCRKECQLNKVCVDFFYG